MGHEIVNECRGLPVAIAVIASSLKGQRGLEEWEVALNSLQKPMSMQGVDENLVSIYRSWKHGYDYIKDEKAKRLLLLCAVFREDEQLSIEILAQIGIGAGFFGEDYDKYNNARSEVVVAKNKLIDSCLLLIDEKRRLKMHDLVCDVARWIANNCIQEVNLSNCNIRRSLKERGENIKYLLCRGKDMDVFSMSLDSSKLEILILYIDGDYTLEIPNSFFQNMIELRVFHLLNNKWIRTQSLPQSIQSLTNIRSLLLEEFELGDISILGKLQSLETLDLVWCKFLELPRGIAELEKLKLLNLNHCTITSEACIHPFEIIERCLSLEELCFINIYGCWRSNAPIHQQGALPTWQRYRLMYDERINDSISKCVTLWGIETFVSESIFKYLVQEAEFLQLQPIGGWRNLMPEIVPIEKGMNDLNELHLRSCSQLQCLIDINSNSREQNVFANLVVLDLEEMENLEELCNGPFPIDFLKSLEWLNILDCKHLRSMLFKSKLSLCNLRSITLFHCQELVSLIQLSTSRSLKLLEDLAVEECKILRNIITDDDDDEEIANVDDENRSCGSMFPNLKSILISRCPQLEVIFPSIVLKKFRYCKLSI